ncbi:TIGR03085 family metal-binding protein [Georgenia sp. Z1491]|uniref:TIGR03085 family metal-binding protein n=1 Tax=Georgenia sp. Z1491 TaxID=3416707 RepID=UPI003CED738A
MSDERRPVDVERAAIARTLAAADPGAPTLCAGWRVVDLAAHLVLRERRPDLVLRDLLSGAEPGREPHLQRLVADALDPVGYRALAARVATGPPRWSPLRLAESTTNLVELVVHHEDVRRGPRDADGASEPAEPRDDLTPDLLRELWQRVRSTAGLMYRSSGTGVVLVVPGGPRATVRRGADAVAVVGDPVELALHANGRRRAAQVTLEGRPETIDRFLAGLSGDVPGDAGPVAPSGGLAGSAEGLAGSAEGSASRGAEPGRREEQSPERGAPPNLDVW